MSVVTEKFVTKPFLVDAIQVTDENMEELAKWCGGTIQTEKRGKKDISFIKVNVQSPLTDRQSKAFAGDWILSSNSGYKVYTQKAFDNRFERYGKPEVVGQDQLTGLANKFNTKK